MDYEPKHGPLYTFQQDHLEFILIGVFGRLPTRSETREIMLANGLVEREEVKIPRRMEEYRQMLSRQSKNFLMRSKGEKPRYEAEPLVTATTDSLPKSGKREAPGIWQRVYVISADGEPVKIGIAKDTARRLAAIQTSQPRPMKLRYQSEPMASAHDVEREIHKALLFHRLKGEWFDLAPDKAIEVVRRVIRERGPT